ncbi:P-loop containing nucleoside triphosphate hydrolase protein [Lojkania enalia]|uniref:P-loop containing nucleoside triphosphate hydrolase protein n=1 Tax=Lojkania enalia TaxID=147567 RepID=A0A9P4K969_9PLEO|nr:P-loop containing nucleoside triphosphate hydrolase protein [Didymosphaeria enalia]
MVQTMDNDNKATQNLLQQASPPLELVLVFILGPPAAGKSTLCRKLGEKYLFNYVGVGNELRDLTANSESARARVNLADQDIQIIKYNLENGLLVPRDILCKYLEQRIFRRNDMLESGSSPGVVLVDGFPRDATQWETFKTAVQTNWKSNNRSGVISIHCNKDIARKWFISRARGDDDATRFEQRFCEYEKNKQDIDNAIARDNLSCWSIAIDDERNFEKLHEEAKKLEAWSVLRNIINNGKD